MFVLFFFVACLLVLLVDYCVWVLVESCGVCGLVVLVDVLVVCL